MVRIDPFAFPSDTSLRFLLLTSFVFGWTILLAVSIAARLVVDPATEAAVIACGGRLFAGFDPDRMNVSQFLEGAAFSDCLGPVPQVGRFSFVILLVTVMIAVAAYYAHHLVIVRRQRLVALPLDAMPALASTLSELCRRAGLARPVSFFWNPLAPHGARAFGRPGRPLIALTGGLVAQSARDPERFAVTVLHELAHHRNRDVGMAFAAMAVWWAFVFAVVLPYAAIEILRLVRSADVSSWAWGNLRLAFIVVVVYLTRNALLRARELYADARVAGWVPQAAILAAVSECQAATRSGRWPPVLLAVHPPVQQRRQALEQPSSLLRATGWDAFGTGLAATAVIVPGMFAFLVVAALVAELEVLEAGLAVAFAPIVMAFVPGGVAAAAVALMVWRMHIAGRLADAPAAPVGRLAWALALGFALGLTTAFPFARLLLTGGLGGEALAAGVGRAASSAAAVLALVVLVPLLHAFLAWVRAAADAWLMPLLGTPRPWRLATGLVAIGSLAMGSIIATLLFGHVVLSVTLPFTRTAEALATVLSFYGMGLAGAIVFNPLMLFAIVLAIVLPLAAAPRERAGPPEALPDWIDASGVTAAPAPPARPPLRPGLALVLGLAAGALFLVAMPLALRMGLLALVQSLGGGTLTYLGYVAPAVFWQALVAGLVAAMMPRHPILHGLLACLVAGLLAALTLLLVPWLFGADVGFDPWFMLANVLYPGTLLGWVAGAAGAAVGRR